MNNYIAEYLIRFSRISVKGIALCLIFSSTLSYAEQSILTVMSGDGKTYHNFHSSLGNNSQNNISYIKIKASEISLEILNKYDVVITVGYKAALIVSKYKPTSTILYSLIPDSSYVNSNITCNNKRCYKVYVSQPLYRYISLFKTLFPARRNLRFATIHTSSQVSQQINKLSAKNNFTYKELKIDTDSNISRILTNKLNRHDVLLALPNSSIYNANNAKSIILSSYHKNVPIIAYSKSFAKAGALISLYSSIDNVADTTARLVNKIINNGQQVKKVHYPDDFSIEINSAVASSLNVNIDSEDIVKSKIE